MCTTFATSVYAKLPVVTFSEVPHEVSYFRYAYIALEAVLLKLHKCTDKACSRVGAPSGAKLWPYTGNCAKSREWTLLQVNFDPIQEIVPKIGRWTLLQVNFDLIQEIVPKVGVCAFSWDYSDYTLSLCDCVQHFVFASVSRWFIKETQQ